MAAQQAQADQPAEEEEKPEMLQLPSRKCFNLYSETELSRNLSEYVNDCAGNLGYDVDTFYSNIRILLSTLACAVGVFASVWLPYPDYKEWLMVSIVLFFSIMFAIFLIDAYIIQGATTCIRDSRGRQLFIGVGVDTKEAAAVFSVRREGSILSHSIPLGKCFDTEGYLLTDNVSAALKTVFKDFEKGITDSSKKVSKKNK